MSLARSSVRSVHPDHLRQFVGEDSISSCYSAFRDDQRRLHFQPRTPDGEGAAVDADAGGGSEETFGTCGCNGSLFQGLSGQGLLSTTIVAAFFTEWAPTGGGR